MNLNRVAVIAVLSAVIGGLATGAFAARVKLLGSGASFPYPIYATWFHDFSTSGRDIQVNYQPKGSGAGIRDFMIGVVDFAASDSAMKEKDMAKVEGGVQLLPMTAGEVVLAFNLKGVDKLRLSRRACAGIFLGTVKRWNDPVIAAANPGVNLPDTPITVVTRADSSGTTFVFTRHLSAISAAFKQQTGVAKQPAWPAAVNMIKSPKNDGVTASIRKSSGSIGYIEYGYARIAKLPMALLENREGNYVAPGPAGGQSALAHIEIPENMIAFSSDPGGKESYPITTYTWLVFHKKYADADKAAALRRLINYCLDDGQAIAAQLGYIPLPATVIDKVKKAAQNIK